METTQIFSTLVESWWVWLAVIVVWGYVIMRYLMSAMEKKDEQNQQNMDLFREALVKNTEALVEFKNVLTQFKIKQ